MKLRIPQNRYKFLLELIKDKQSKNIHFILLPRLVFPHIKSKLIFLEEDKIRNQCLVHGNSRNKTNDNYKNETQRKNHRINSSKEKTYNYSNKKITAVVSLLAGKILSQMQMLHQNDRDTA